MAGIIRAAVLYCVLSVQVSAENISISLEPKTINVCVNEEITLVCHANVSHTSNLTLSWSGPFTPRDPKLVNNTTSLSGTLNITAKVAYHGKKVFCSVDSSDGTTRNDSVSLAVSDISIRLEPTSINVRVGENITLVCLANAYCHSNLTLYWKAPFSPIENDTMRVNETSVTDTLKTTARVDYDGETIYCNVNSSDGIMKSVSVSLTVIVVNITMKPDRVEVFVGENITLDCQVNIYIPFNVTLSWSGPISRGSVFVVNETTTVSDRLVVPAKESYNGQVMFCNVSVNGTIYSASATLIVRGVNITLLPMKVEVTVGDNITLDCQVNINIPSHMNLSWSGPICRESMYVVNRTSVSGGLIEPAKESYNGQVMSCNVFVYGTFYNASVTLQVREVNITLPNRVEVVVGDIITLDCLVNINIPSNITLSWSGPISHEPVSVVNETSISDRLVVPAKESYDGSVLFCNVSVSGTCYSASATLTVRVPTLSASIEAISSEKTCSNTTMLLCNINESNYSFESNITSCQWFQNGSVIQNENTNMYEIQMGYLEDYSCQCNGSSDLLDIRNYLTSNKSANFKVTSNLISLQSFKSHIYPSNSNVFSITDVGEGAKNAISCKTDIFPCCKAPHVNGEWLYSNYSKVPIKRENKTVYYRNRDENQTVFLHLRNDSRRYPGIFYCTFPSSNNSNLCISVEIVTTSFDIIILTNGSQLLGKSLTLQCFPSSSTLFNTTWMRCNSQAIISSNSSAILNPLQLSDQGCYTCNVKVDKLVKRRTIDIKVVTDPISSIVTTGNTTSFAGNPLNLTCTAVINPNVSITPTFEWTGQMLSRESTEAIVKNLNSTTFQSILSIQRVMESYNGTYTCYVMVDDYTNISDYELHVTTLIPTSPIVVIKDWSTIFIAINWTQSSTDIVDSYNIFVSVFNGCSNIEDHENDISGSLREYNITSLEEFTNYSISVTAVNQRGSSSYTTVYQQTKSTKPGCCVPRPTTTVGLTTFTATWAEEQCSIRNGLVTNYVIVYGEANTTTIGSSESNIRNFTAKHLFPSTTYVIKVALNNTVGVGPYVIHNINTSTPQDVHFILNGECYSNNSYMEFDMAINTDIFCVTNFTECCKNNESPNNAAWNLPNKSKIATDSSYNTYFSGRKNTLILHIRSISQILQGIYKCQIPISESSSVALYAGLYLPGQGSPKIVDMTYDPKSGVITCISTGGPATSVFWNRNGTTNQIISNFHNATYTNKLIINGSLLEDYKGIFNCTVENTRGSNSSSIGEFYDVNLYGNRDLYSLGSTASVTCFSNLTVLSLIWQSNCSSTNLISMGRNNRLHLQIEHLNETHNNSIYKCSAVIELPFGTNITTSISFSVIINGSISLRNFSSTTVSHKSSVSAVITWSFHGDFNRVVPETCLVQYRINATLNNSSITVTVNGSNNYSICLNGLSPATDYEFRVHCFHEQFVIEGIQTEFMNLRTDDSKSGAVINVIVKPFNDSTLEISWCPPLFPNGNITSYSIKVMSLQSETSITESNNILDTSYVNHNLSAGVPYNVSIAAVNKAGLGHVTTATVFTRELVPNTAPHNVKVTRTSSTTANVAWTKLTLVESRGFITNYTISYYPLSMKREVESFKKIENRNEERSLLMDLEENSEYFLMMAASTREGLGKYSNSILIPKHGQSSEAIAAATFVGLGAALAFMAVAIICVVFLTLCVWKRRKQGQSKHVYTASKLSNRNNKDITMTSISPSVKPLQVLMEADEQTYENTEFMRKDRMKHISLDEFRTHVAHMHADRDRWFESEYNSVEKAPKLPHVTSLITANHERNRFNNIYPFDFNRIILQTIPTTEHSDYINASYIDGYGRESVYVAAQGPTENSVEDFWRMIWEKSIPTIVMLTKVYEGKKKCEKYWPENCSKPYKPHSESVFTVEMNSSVAFAEYTIRKMTITKNKETPHQVVMFHYLAWPDHGVPANAISMLNFVKKVRKTHPYHKQDLVLVHCSAGVGRTGTFITLDYMLERIKHEQSINVYEYVSGLRKQRVLMVQSLVQYIFIHSALDELITCGDTEIAAANMRIVIGRLSRTLTSHYKTGFDDQIEILEDVTCDIPSSNTSDATSELNKDKNRYESYIPFNHTRVHLKFPTTPGCDYINASYVEGYRKPGAYIATQGPLSNTLIDFWKMVWEQEVKCIVMLCNSEENGKMMCHNYWPSEKGATEAYGRLTVTLAEKKAFNGYMIRKLQLLETHTRTSVAPDINTVTQFQYLSWMEDEIPDSTSSILEIANLIQKVQMGTGNKPIVVMCNNGVGRTGAFICMHAQMEKMKSEGVVDIFQFLKSVRYQRAKLVCNKELYIFCHHVLADFLDGFDTYANFKEIV